MFTAAFRSACSSKPQWTQAKVAWFSRERASIAPQLLQVRDVFRGSTLTRLPPDAILRDGFHEYTYFASGLQDAIGFGGSYVFGVAMDLGDDEPWQIKNSNHIPISQIVSLDRYDVESIYNNQALADDVFAANAHPLLPPLLP